MNDLTANWRRITILFLGWTLVGLVFAAVSYGVALSQNDPRFGIAAALKLNLVPARWLRLTFSVPRCSLDIHGIQTRYPKLIDI
jgi:hypothetical protein